jgi:hypothetical protein
MGFFINEISQNNNRNETTTKLESETTQSAPSMMKEPRTLSLRMNWEMARNNNNPELEMVHLALSMMKEPRMYQKPTTPPRW